jgi:hypothetical protein
MKPRAFLINVARREIIDEDALHRTNCYLNDRLEQDHCGIRGLCRPILGFKSVASARRYCRGHDELRSFLRSRSHMCQHVPGRYTTLSLHAPDSHRALASWGEVLKVMPPTRERVSHSLLDFRKLRSYCESREATSSLQPWGLSPGRPGPLNGGRRGLGLSPCRWCS